MKNIKLILISLLAVGVVFAQEVEEEKGLSKWEKENNAHLLAIEAEATKAAEAGNAGNMTKGLAGIGAGLVVLGAGFGIGRIFGSAAEATARQPEAANEIRSTVNLPLFLLEVVGIIGLVVCILAVVL